MRFQRAVSLCKLARLAVRGARLEVGRKRGSRRFYDALQVGVAARIWSGDGAISTLRLALSGNLDLLLTSCRLVPHVCVVTSSRRPLSHYRRKRLHRQPTSPNIWHLVVRRPRRNDTAPSFPIEDRFSFLKLKSFLTYFLCFSR
jgi:hypothetical protein